MEVEQLKKELAEYGKTLDDWLNAFPITAPDFVYSMSVERLANQMGWKKIDSERKTEKFTCYPFGDQINALKTEAANRGKNVTASDVLREILDGWMNSQK